MLLRKEEALLQKINLQKAEGKIEWVTGMFYVLLLAILLCAQLQIAAYGFASSYMEDALAVSNLASAVIDIEEYGISHMVKIANPLEAYERYKSAVRENLQLNDSWECTNSVLISGTVTIERYIVYNMEPDVVHIYEVSDDGRVSTFQGIPGVVRAPDGNLITATSVYSEISFPVKGFLQIEIRARKGKLADVVSNKAVSGNE